MAEFYVNSDALDDGSRQVHLHDCRLLPAPDRLRYLGSFGNREAAFTKAGGWYSGVHYCPHCLPQSVAAVA